ncbi:X-linked lymphocyte-regulated protein 3C-like [Mesocricetus auratus]|uniref:X-linked lymphocyte-regulated protein 3C-like n=1 Tax=Mesocricetus auratus TaxID=10036 RepID=A0ABM2XDA7_MESAU|nr:X-linked lymphocyte-regulated protein 3C-like [Mesocricetus auratus]
MASKIKSKPPKQSEMTPDLPSDDLQLLSENNPPENNPGNRPALETSGENSSSHKTGGPKPGPSKESLHGRRKKYMHSVSKTIYNIEQNSQFINSLLNKKEETNQKLCLSDRRVNTCGMLVTQQFFLRFLQDSRALNVTVVKVIFFRQEIYQEHSHQFLNLVVMWNIDADEVKKHGENLSNILDQQQELFHQFQVIHKQKIEEFKELCNRHLKNLQAIKSCRRKAILEESRNQMDLLERKLTTETVKLQEEKAGVRSSLLSLLFS